MVKKIATGTVIALGMAFSSQSFATVVGGVEIGPAPTGFVVKFTETLETTVSAVGDVLQGVGRVNSINSNADFCVSCTDLTYYFHDLTVSSFSPTEIVFTGGAIDFYRNDGASVWDPFNAGDLNGLLDQATTGTLWLSASFSEIINGAGQTGSLFGSGDSFGTGNDNGNGNFNLDVTGGLADVVAALDTNFFDVTRANGTAGTTDFNVDSSFGPGGPGFAPLTGTTTFRGAAGAVDVPEPETAALLGLGLFGLLITRRKKALA